MTNEKAVRYFSNAALSTYMPSALTGCYQFSFAFYSVYKAVP